MKRFVYLFTLALLSLSTNVMAQSGTTQPPLQPEGKPMYQTGKKFRRTPSMPVYVYQNGRTLMFDEEHAGDTVIVMDGDNVVFTTSVDSDCSIEIPSDIVGEMKILLICGDTEYYVYLEF